MQVQLVEGQSKAGLDAGNVALKTPVYDWGYSGQFGDEINWGSSIVQVPYLLYKLYGDTQTMRDHFDAMKTYMDFVARRKATDLHRHRAARRLGLVRADLAAAARHLGLLPEREVHVGDGGADRPQRGRRGLRRAGGEHQDRVQQPVLQHDAAPLHRGRQRRHDRRDPDGAGRRARRRPRARGRAANVLNALVENIYAYQPFGGGPHFSAGHVGLGPVVRSLLEGGRSDVLWDVMQEDTRPSYGFLLQPTAAHPEGMTTDARALDARRLAEPHDPAADRGVVPHRRRRHQAGARTRSPTAS